MPSSNQRIKHTPKGSDRSQLPDNKSSYVESEVEEVRINKCLPSLSRRGADAAVAEGRVTVNGQVITSAGFKVKWNDVVKLDGKKQQWQTGVRARLTTPGTDLDEQELLYLKYWKPQGVTCTSDPKDPSNIISQGKFNMLPQRVFTVGRLDRGSSGLILLTSDGRVNAALLHRSQVKEKVYEVTTLTPLSEAHLQALREGLLITTPIQRDHYKKNGYTRLMTAKTLPCQVVRLAPNRVQMTLVEGRNRQIRRMMDALGVEVMDLHRLSFAGITLQGLSRPGAWKELSPKEMHIIRNAITKGKESRENEEEDDEDDDEEE